MKISTIELVYFKQLVNASITEFNKEHVVFAIRFYQNCIVIYFSINQVYFCKVFTENSEYVPLQSLQKISIFKQYFLYPKDFCDVIKQLSQTNTIQISYQENPDKILFTSVENTKYKLTRTYSINTIPPDEQTIDLQAIQTPPQIAQKIDLTEFSSYIKDLHEIMQYNKFKHTTYYESLDYVIFSSKKLNDELAENHVYRFSKNLFANLSYKTNLDQIPELYIPLFFVSFLNIIFQNEHFEINYDTPQIYYCKSSNRIYIDNAVTFFKIQISHDYYCPIKSSTVESLLEDFKNVKQKVKIKLPKSFFLEIFNIASSTQDCELKFFVEKDKTTVKTQVEHHEKTLIVDVENENQISFSINLKQIYIMFHKNNMFNDLIEFYFYDYKLYREEAIHGNQNMILKFIAACYGINTNNEIQQIPNDLQKR